MDNAHRMDIAHVRVIKRGRYPGFVEESLLRRRNRVSMCREHLYRDRPVEPRVLGPVDNPHAATTQLFEDFIVGYAFADHPDSEQMNLE